MLREHPIWVYFAKSNWKHGLSTSKFILTCRKFGEGSIDPSPFSKDWVMETFLWLFAEIPCSREKFCFVFVFVFLLSAKSGIESCDFERERLLSPTDWDGGKVQCRGWGVGLAIRFFIWVSKLHSLIQPPTHSFPCPSLPSFHSLLSPSPTLFSIYGEGEREGGRRGREGEAKRTGGYMRGGGDWRRGAQREKGGRR